MTYIILLICEILVLFLLSKNFTKKIITLLYRLTKSKKLTTYLYALLFFPGTIIHEMAHFLSALFLFVPIGKINLFPIIEDNESERNLQVRLGSVAIAKVDVIRGFLVGIAPFILGLAFILLGVHFLIMNDTINIYLRIASGGFIIFEVGNTMFLSKSDMKSALGFIAILVIFIIMLYLIGFRISLEPTNSVISAEVLSVLKNSVYFLLFPIIVDTMGVIILKGVR